MVYKTYVRKKAKEWGLIIPNNYKEILKEYHAIVKQNGCNLLFTKSIGINKLNARAPILNIMFFTPDWLAVILLKNDTYTKNAFILTVGHELAHTYDVTQRECRNFIKKRLTHVETTFLKWSNEVAADFKASKMLNSQTEFVNALKYKQQYKQQYTIDTDNDNRPSWNKRIYYAQNCNTIQEALSQIYKDLGCNNNKLYLYIKNHFL